MKTQNRKFLNLFTGFGPLALPLYIVICGISILFVFRAALTATYFSRLSETPRFWMLFPVGLRMDLVLLSYAVIIPALCGFLLSEKIYANVKKTLALLFTIFMCSLIYMEIATFPYLEEFDMRPEQKYLEYLQHVYEVFTTIFKVYKLEISIAVIILILAARFFWKSINYVLLNQTKFSFKSRLLLFPLIGALIFLGARSTLGHRPANLSTAAFSDNHLANEFALNSTYTLAYAAYRMYRHEKNPSLFYGKMDRAEVFERVKKVSILAGTPLESEIPFLQKQHSPFKTDRPPNVVIFLQESMGAVDVGCLKGPDITPNLCKLKDEGLWLTNLYATGTRTVRGIESVVSSFLPTPARGVVKLGLSQTGFFTAASLFKSMGYSTHFLYGGMSNFDEMKSFFLGNDFETIYDQPTFVNPVYEGTWGVSDEDLVRKANEIYKSQGDKPFFSLMLSTSNHIPYEFPDGRIELYEQPKQTHLNAIKYADYSIGLLMELARKEKYFENTIFLIVGDHNSHVKGNDLVPVSKFHIPALILGPNVPKKLDDILSSQIDLLPTILHFTGFDSIHPMIGRDLMSLPEGTKGRSFMQYGNNLGYRIADDVVILAPFQEPQYFTYDEKEEKLLPVLDIKPPMIEMSKDALAYAFLPWFLYSEKLYHLPKK
jgi:phosphoglycerol transferase MdoB-like AlkP superfamily enzyme